MSTKHHARLSDLRFCAGSPVCKIKAHPSSPLDYLHLHMNLQHKERILLAVAQKAKENSRLEFKERIELTSTSGKAEFVRDVLGLANSEGEIPREVAHLVLGVGETLTIGTPLGIYDGATLRDIVRSCIAPDLQVDYEEFPTADGVRIGVLEITPDPLQLYVVKKDISCEDKKLVVAGQAWGRIGDQKVKLDGDGIVARIAKIKSYAASQAQELLQRRLTELEEILKRSGPAADVRRIGYAIELETDWLAIPEQLSKLLPYARDFGLVVAFEIVQILKDLAERLSAGTPITAIRSFTGVFRAILPFSSGDALRPRSRPSTDDERKLILKIGRTELSMCRDGATRLKNPEIVEICSKISHECLSFAHETGERDLEQKIVSMFDSLISACAASEDLEIRKCVRLLQYYRDDGLLTRAERLEIYRREMEGRLHPSART